MALAGGRPESRGLFVAGDRFVGGGGRKRHVHPARTPHVAATVCSSRVDGWPTALPVAGESPPQAACDPKCALDRSSRACATRRWTAAARAKERRSPTACWTRACENARQPRATVSWTRDLKRSPVCRRHREDVSSRAPRPRLRTDRSELTSHHAVPVSSRSSASSERERRRRRWKGPPRTRVGATPAAAGRRREARLGRASTMSPESMRWIVISSAKNGLPSVATATDRTTSPETDDPSEVAPRGRRARPRRRRQGAGARYPHDARGRPGGRLSPGRGRSPAEPWRGSPPRRAKWSRTRYRKSAIVA